MRIISFDVATKSLAVSVINYNYNLDRAFKHIQRKHAEYKAFRRCHTNQGVEIFTKYNELLEYTDNMLQNMFTIEMLEVTDLIPNKKLKETNIVERTAKLHEYLLHLDSRAGIGPDCKILIEYQMGPNDKSRVISSQILYHYSKYFTTAAGDNIQLIGPTLKNKIFLLNDLESKYSSFISKYTTNYAANKNHSKYNFLKIIDIYGYRHLISTIHKKNIDDIADSTLMSIAFATQTGLM